jgi:hypothetical protein
MAGRSTFTANDVRANIDAITGMLTSLGASPFDALRHEGRQLGWQRFDKAYQLALDRGNDARADAIAARVEREAAAHARRRMAQLGVKPAAASSPVPPMQPSADMATAPQPIAVPDNANPLLANAIAQPNGASDGTLYTDPRTGLTSFMPPGRSTWDFLDAKDRAATGVAGKPGAPTPTNQLLGAALLALQALGPRGGALPRSSFGIDMGPALKSELPQSALAEKGPVDWLRRLRGDAPEAPAGLDAPQWLRELQAIQGAPAAQRPEMMDLWHRRWDQTAPPAGAAPASPAYDPTADLQRLLGDVQGLNRMPAPAAGPGPQMGAGAGGYDPTGDLNAMLRDLQRLNGESGLPGSASPAMPMPASMPNPFGPGPMQAMAPGADPLGEFLGGPASFDYGLQPLPLPEPVPRWSQPYVLQESAAGTWHRLNGQFASRREVEGLRPPKR